jgi:hypothetical protein
MTPGGQLEVSKVKIGNLRNGAAPQFLGDDEVSSAGAYTQKIDGVQYQAIRCAKD